MGLIHKTCLETWFCSSNSNECEICHHKYTVQCEKRSFLEVCDPIRLFWRPAFQVDFYFKWLRNYDAPSVREDLNDLIRDLVCFFILTVAEVITVGYRSFFFNSRCCPDRLSSPRLIVFTVIHYNLWESAWEAIGIAFSTFFLIFFYVFWIVVSPATGN
jgi:hypothetical protein